MCKYWTKKIPLKLNTLSFNVTSEIHNTTSDHDLADIGCFIKWNILQSTVMGNDIRITDAHYSLRLPTVTIIFNSGGRRLSSRAQLVFSRVFKKEHWDWRIQDASCSVYHWTQAVTSRSFSGWDSLASNGSLSLNSKNHLVGHNSTLNSIWGWVYQLLTNSLETCSFVFWRKILQMLWIN